MTKHSATLACSSASLKFYEAIAVAEDVKNQLEETAQYLINASRRSTDDAFKLGEHFERAARLLPERTLEKWAAERCGYTARHVRTQRAVFRNLSTYKEILVELAVGPTVLGKLSAAEPEQIKQAIAFATELGRLRVQDVTSIIAASKNVKKAAPHIDPYDVGGVDGLKTIIAIKVRDGLKSFLGNLVEINNYVKEALPNKNIVKKTLADQIVLTARLARRELESLAQFVMPNPNCAHVMWESSLPPRTRWSIVGDLLYKMGSIESWPEKDKLRVWLETQVVPVLEWAISKNRNPDWPLVSQCVVSPQFSTSLDPSSVVGDQPVDKEQISTGTSSDREMSDAASVKRLETMLAPFNATVVIEPSWVKSENASETVPLRNDAQARPRVDRTARSTAAD